MINEDWNILVSMFPIGWREKAKETGALRGLRKCKSEEDLLRTLLIHLAGGFSLRETVVRAREANLADLSDVALLKRLRKSSDWLASLCEGLFEERGVKLENKDGFEVRLLDATVVKEPGRTGSLWKVHYSLRLPTFKCEYFRVTQMNGIGTGESFKQFDLKPGDYIIGDRGYGQAPGIKFAVEQKASLLVRISPHHVVVSDSSGKPFNWLDRLSEVSKSGQACSWNVHLQCPDKTTVSGRVCVIRKSEQAILKAHKRIKKHAIKKSQKLKPETLIYAEFVIVFTTFEESSFPPAEILRWYRLRWQVELVFKRFKQLAELGHLPKYTDESSKAWLYGKLFVALLNEKLIWQAQTFSPWGYDIINQGRDSKPLA